jgi:hypothetical protein
MKQKLIFFLTILLSLGLHVLGYLGVLRVPDLPPFELRPQKNVEIEIIHQPEKNQRQQVTQVDIPKEVLLPSQEDLLDLRDKASFLSEKTQRVKKELQAKESGLSQNSKPGANQIETPNTPSPQQGSEALAHGKGRQKIQLYPSLDQALLQKAQKKSHTGTQNDSYSLGSLGSRTMDALPNDIDFGDITVLNTDALTYYTFYQRIRESVYPHWHDLTHKALEYLPSRLLHEVSGKEWITEIEFWLKPNGEYHSAHVHRESGIKNFDLAAIKSFEQSKIFPNPPKDLIESDGYVHVKYSFILKTYGLSDSSKGSSTR